MSRAPPSDLYALIKALSQAEKRYVKMELRRHVLGEVNQSELLFDALAAQEAPDEAAIKRRFADHGFARRLPEAKRELMHVILRAMRQFHSERSANRRAMSALQDTDFLRLRSQYHWAERRRNDALDEATLINNHAMRALILQSQAALNRALEDHPAPQSPPDEDPLYREALHLAEVAYFEAIADRMQSIIYHYGRSGGAVAAALADDLVRAGEARFPIETSAAKSSWLRVLSLKALFVDNDPPTALRYDRSRLDAIERDERFRRANLHEWANLTHSVALRLILMRDFAAARPIRDKMLHHWKEGTKHVSPANRMAAASQYLNIEVQLALQSNELEEIAPRIPMMDEVLATHEHDTLTEVGIAINNNIALIEVGLGKTTQALRRLAHVLSYPETIRPDIHDAAHLLTILLHIDEGNDSVVTSLVRAERRRIKGRTSEPDRDILLSVASRYFGLAPGSPRTKVLTEAAEQIDTMYREARKQPLTAIFDFRSWLRSKIRGTTWREELYADVP